MKPYIQYRSNGRIWQAGRTIWGLCAAYNHATNPSVMMSDYEHSRSFAYARAIKARMARLGYRHGSNYVELSNGTLWPRYGMKKA